MKLVELNDWFYGSSSHTPSGEEHQQEFLAGTVTGHPSYEDGATVVIFPVEFDCARQLVRSNSGSIYHLGDVSKIWTKKHPEVEQLLRDRLRTVLPGLTASPGEL